MAKNNGQHQSYAPPELVVSSFLSKTLYRLNWQLCFGRTLQLGLWVERSPSSVQYNKI